MSSLQRFATDKGVEITYTELGLVKAPNTWHSEEVYGYKVKVQRGRKSFTFPYYMGVGLADKRPDHNVLECLFLDAMAFRDTKGIEEFAREFGYEMYTPKEIRAVKKIYKGCEDTLMDLEHLFTEEEIDELGECL